MIKEASRYFRLEVDAGDALGDLPMVDAEILTRSAAGIKLVTQNVKAKGGLVSRGRIEAMLPDLLLVVGSTPLMLSNRARELLLSLRTDPDIEWFPVQVTWRRAAFSFWACETMTNYDIWDYTRSDFALLDENGPRDQTNIAYLRQGLANSKLFPALDLFRAEFNEWIGSERLMDAWMEAGFDGIKFLHLAVASHDPF